MLGQRAGELAPQHTPDLSARALGLPPSDDPERGPGPCLPLAPASLWPRVGCLVIPGGVISHWD